MDIRLLGKSFLNTFSRWWAFSLLFVLNFLSFASHAAFNTLPVYFSRLGMSHTFVGFFMNIHVAGLVFFVMFLLPFTERMGKKRMMFFPDFDTWSHINS